MADTVGLESNISLLVATFDLAIVKSITGAIRAADAASGKLSAATPLGPAPNPLIGRGISGDRYEHRKHLLAAPVYEQRRHIHPTPRYEPRPVIHPTPRVEGEFPAPSPSPAPMKLGGLEAPWKSVPWKNPTPAPEKIKVIQRVHDKVQRGQIIDLFI